ncbi:hypothetical protein D3C77_421310 [compost metagenome]
MNPLAQGQVIHLAGVDLFGTVAIALHLTRVIEHHKVGFGAAPGIDLDPLTHPISHLVVFKRDEIRLQQLYRVRRIAVMLVARHSAEQAAAKHLTIA